MSRISLEPWDDEESIRRWRADPEGLRSPERWWAEHSAYLKEHGYLLRPRYQPDWQRSWKAKGVKMERVEDGQRRRRCIAMDATRLSDGAYVVLKKVTKSTDLFEVELGQLLSSDPLASDPRNHSVRYSDVLDVPDDDGKQLIVIPLLRAWDDPRFQSIGEACAFFRQIFEGLEFLHEQHIAHRDCTRDNIMMDASPMFKVPWHPVKTDRRRDWTGKVRWLPRTKCPPKYYFIDFGHARKYNPNDGPPRELPLPGGDKSVPEHQRAHYNTPHDPFPTDIYYIGNFIRTHVMGRWHGFDFMKPLIADMVRNDPSKRPDIHEVVKRYDEIMKSLSWWKLRARVASRKEFPAAKLWRVPIHVFRTTGYVLQRTPAVPKDP